MKVLFTLLTFMFFMMNVANACSLFAAQGNMFVADGGSIIAKNRDFTPGVQSIKLFPKSEKNKYAVYALYGNRGGEGPANVCVAGVNEKGLTIVSAMASSIPKKQREAMPKKAITRKMLSNCATVEEALALDCLGPRFLMLADSTEIAYLEIGEDGAKAIKRIKNGSLVHTNHYLSENMQYLNIRIKESSKARYERLEELFEDESEPYTMEVFKAFSADKVEGPNNSIWREGLGPNKSQTLASFIVRIKEAGEFDLYLKYREHPNEKGKEKIIELNKKQIFGDIK